MLKAIAAVAFWVALPGWTFSAYGEDASREKCTCDVEHGPVQEHGAVVNNATACWSTVDVQREWCQITVQALEGDPQHDAIISQFTRADDPERLVGVLQNLAALSTTADKEQAPEVAKAKAELPAVIKSFDKLAQTCIDGFLKPSENKEERTNIDEGAFACRVGKETGWLRLSYRVGEVQFVFMIAPNG
ncbi:hypothetical protein [Mesorhizobium sp.]|uniref:hypothetical protein n=1 Tax=Mesorhizobium sp. TaxID=1871066 RepID=UPI000FE4EE05|nr:hypothetical protein [Mesorhizobium sp.]RWM24336.1 MAG: hypothetical protein EOR74_25295 [Mesorhizobium sp.]RWM37201.1 MAG: hypothetical protein EOR75_20940 [Mesorhizobium sp.]TJV51296.1 MAG: hypothetical protein E5Y01_15255 [Mesorhizobium sp.]